MVDGDHGAGPFLLGSFFGRQQDHIDFSNLQSKDRGAPLPKLIRWRVLVVFGLVALLLAGFGWSWDGDDAARIVAVTVAGALVALWCAETWWERRLRASAAGASGETTPTPTS